MTILIVTDAWHPQVNGVVTTLTKTSEVLEDWGYKVKVISPDDFRTIPCPTYPEIRLSCVTPGKIRALLLRTNPDAVHIVTEGPLGWTARSACLKENIPFTTSYHTRFPEYIRLRLPVPLSWSYAVVRRFHHAAAGTMAAPTIIDELNRRGFRHLVPWSRGVDTGLFRPYQEDCYNGPRPVFLYTGRVAVEKNLTSFLDLDLPGSKVVIGDGPDRQSLSKRYPEVLFTGAKKGEDLARHMASADVFVFPSLTDTFGVVMLEAMACGLPVAAYPVTGPNYLIKNGVNGFIDSDLQKAALQALKIGPSQCRLFARKYSWQGSTDQFVNNLAWRGQL
ncbi:MAG TPA: glycosyltransferase family 1 protein [Desulfobulbaceae bacterium]|nr:glycosyltransferase family 1 protein [Desulfobulbaceae bacterium]